MVLSDVDMSKSIAKYQCKTKKITYEFPVDYDNVWNKMQKLLMKYCEHD